MNSKAQLFSIDFLFSVAVAVFAIGTIMNAAQIKGFSAMQDAEYQKLVATGDLASDLLVTRPEHTCILVGSGGTPLGNLPNCFSGQSDKIDATNLGLTSDYSCGISLEQVSGYTYLPGDPGNGFNGKVGNSCKKDSSSAKGSVYSSRRLVVLMKGNGDLGKSDFADCLDGSCSELVPYYVVLKVWKA